MKEKANILLVDDLPARLLTYEAILGCLDQNLVRAQSGEEALAKLLEMEVATILLDVSMPGMDGFETAAMIRGHPRCAHTPIIFVTGVHLTEIDRLRGYEMGAVDYVSVPVIPRSCAARCKCSCSYICSAASSRASTRRWPPRTSSSRPRTPRSRPRTRASSIN